MPTGIVNSLIDKVADLHAEIASLKADMKWIKAGIYLCAAAVIGQIILKMIH